MNLIEQYADWLNTPDDAGLEHAEADYQDQLLSWHHACQSQARAATNAGYLTRFTAKGWEVWATDLDFGSLVIQAGE